MKPIINNMRYDTLTHRIFCETLERLTNNDDHTAERCYISSNEYLSEYMCNMDLRNKRVVTVGSSGDQFFNALLQGSKDVTIIDANPYSRVFVEYKMAMIENFDFDTFLNLIKSSDMFSWRTHAQISHSLSDTAKYFWGTLMLEIKDEPNDTIDQFDKDKIARQLVHPERVFFSDFYNDEKIYLNLQNLIRRRNFKLKFLTADLHDFPNVLKSKYDLIMLSNIFGYHKEGELRYQFEKVVEKLYENNLNENGTIQVNYDYHPHYYSIGPNEMAGQKLRIVRLDKYHNPKSVFFLDKQKEFDTNEGNNINI